MIAGKSFTKCLIENNGDIKALFHLRGKNLQNNTEENSYQILGFVQCSKNNLVLIYAELRRIKESQVNATVSISW